MVCGGEVVVEGVARWWLRMQKESGGCVGGDLASLAARKTESVALEKPCS